MKSERVAPLVLVSLLAVQVLFLGILLQRVNAVERSVVRLYEALASPSETRLTETVVNVSIENSPYRGNPDAPITIVEFSDFGCPYCQNVQPVLDELLEKYQGEIKLVYRYFPLNQNVDSEVFKAAVAAECANDQGAFWEMHDVLFSNPGEWQKETLLNYASSLNLDEDEFAKCLESEEATFGVQSDLIDGQSYGVTGTPTFFINGRIMVGAQPLTRFEMIIEEILNQES